jgi:hypothetical protein
MTSPWYNPTLVSPNTRALADGINNELKKIKAAFDQLPAPGSVGTGTSATYVHFAYADSIDGTRNFTTGAPGNRRYIGVQANVTSATPSEFPADYAWSLLTSGVTSGEPDEDLLADINEAVINSAAAVTAAATAQATADGKVTTFFQNDAPVAEGVGDLWIDTNDGNKLYRWSGSAWVAVQDAGIGQAITAAATAEAIADSKIVSFYQNEPPTAGAVGDLWIDTNDNNKLYRWSGSAWVAARDAGIAAAQASAAQALTNAANAISAAATAQGTADGKVVTFYQPGAPGAQAVGDLWIDTDDGNKLYRWSGSAWNVVQDASIGAAIAAASTAQSTADGKIVTFYQTSAPTAAAIGDLWIDTDDNNRLYRWSGSAWVNARDASIAIAQAQANDANAAAFAANTAISIITADGFLSRDEKPEIRKQRDDIIAEYPIIRARAVSLSVSVTNYDSAYNTFNISHPAWDLSGATDSPINRNDFNFLFNDYYAKRQTVLDGIALEASKRASSVPLGNTNRVPFSRFEGDRGWAAGGAPSGGQPFRITFEDQEYIVAQPVFSAAGQAHVLYTNPGFPVVPNERLSVSAFAQAFGISSGPNPTTWVFYIEYRDATNTNLGFTGIGSGSGFLSQQLSGFSTVPATARRAVLVLYALSSGAGTVSMALREPMVTSAAADQTVYPPYTPGPNAVDGALPNNLITIDGGGVLSGIGTAGIKVDNALVPLGNANRVPFTRLEGGRGWATAGNFNPTPFLIVSGGRYFICAEPTFTLADQNVYLFSAPRFQVIPGERLSVSARVQAFALSGGLNPNYWALYIEYYPALVGGTQTGSTLLGQGTTAISEGVLHAEFSTVPAGSQVAQLVLRYEADGAGPVRLAILEPMVASATADQTVHPPYAPGPNADDGADVTALAQRSIKPQFPSIEVKQGEAGSAGNGNRTVTHKAFRAAGTVELTGGTWSIVSEDLGAGDAAVNSSTGTVTLSGIVQSGKYALLYVHTDGLSNLDEFNVTYVPTPPSGVVSAKVARTATNNGTDNNNLWQNILTLSVPGCPAGRVNFGGIQQFSFLAPQSTSAGDADFEARLQMDGVTLTSVLSQNVVTGGIMSPTDFTELFNGSYPVSAGTRTFTIDLRRTSGSARILSTATALEATVIAS